MATPREAFHWSIVDEESAHEPVSSMSKEPAPDTGASELRGSKAWELVLVVATIYGLAIGLIWTGANRRIHALEEEMSLLRATADGTPNPAVLQPSPVATESRPRHLPVIIETEMLQFHTTEVLAATVTTVAASSDERYQELLQLLGVPPEQGPAPVINVGLPRPTGGQAHSLTVAAPAAAARRYGISEEEALAAAVNAQLASHAVDRAISVREIKPVWRPLTMTLSLFLAGEFGFGRPQRDPATTPWELAPGSTTLAAVMTPTVQLPPIRSEAGDLGGPEEVPWQEPLDIRMNLLIEYIVVEYGYRGLSSLLDGMEQHSDWDSLIADVYGRSVFEFEQQLHAYLGLRGFEINPADN